MRYNLIQQEQETNSQKKAHGSRNESQLAICPLMSMDGIKRDQTEAATITPDANPRNAFWTLGFNAFFRKNTQAAPAVVPIKGIMIPANILLISIHLCHFLSPNPPFYRNPLSFR